MCCVLSNKQLLKLINHQSGDEILSQFQILFIALPFFIKYPLVVVLCYKMNRTFLLLFYQTSQCHTLLSKHFGCLKIQDTSSSISKASLRKEKRITLAFKTYLSVVSCVTADFFFFHFAIYGTRIARAGQTRGWWRPVFCSCQQTAPAASKKETRSFIASGNLKINLWEIFSQLPWVENSVMPGGRKVCRTFSSPFFFNFLFCFLHFSLDLLI